MVLSDERIKRDITEILENKYTEEKISVVGENREQLFVRIPQSIRQRLSIEKGDKFLFSVSNEKNGHKLSITIIKDKED